MRIVDNNSIRGSLFFAISVKDNYLGPRVYYTTTEKIRSVIVKIPTIHLEAIKTEFVD
jgi:hypothetical protein